MPSAYLLDIEGTTTPIDFVHNVLFPFAKERVGQIVDLHFDSLLCEIAQLKNEAASDETYRQVFDPNSAVSVADYLKFLIDTDRKSTPLKSIQGKIWEAGYEAGQITSQIFPDVPKTLEKWEAEGKIAAIYSSGSVQAQKNLFRYTDHGDLSRFITAYFDTNVGSKQSPESYAMIAEVLSLDPSEILFVSDVPAELEAARSKGLQTVLSIRPGNAKVSGSHLFDVIETFADLP